MKRSLALILSILLLTAVVALPVGATAPQNDSVAAAREALVGALGQDTPGAAIGLYQGGSITMLEGFGYADVEERVLVNPETAFEIGGVSAVFVALAAYRLAEQGLLSLSVNIDTYLPGEIMQELDLAYPVTVSQLLLGTAGFEGRTFDLRFDKDSNRFDSLEDALLAEVPHQIAPPDTFTVYSPFGIALAAFVIEHAADRPYAEYVTAEILAPLGMTHTLLDPTKDTLPETAALGHVATGEGSFTVEKRDGRSYAGLYPTDGAISTAADLSCLLAFLVDGNTAVLSNEGRFALFATTFQNGIFTKSAPCLTVKGAALGVVGNTTCFGAGLWINPATRTGAFVLTNAAGSGLPALAARLCSADEQVVLPTEGATPELKKLRGIYAAAAGESHSFVGRYTRMNENVTVELNDNGELVFEGKTLHEMAPCVFGHTTEQGDVPVLQFVLDEAGEVKAILSADAVYYPAPIWERGVVATVLFFLMLALCAWFLVAGIFSLLRYLFLRRSGDAPSIVHTLPLLFATLMSICALLQVWIGVKLGGAAFSSVFHVLSVSTLVLSIGALVGLILSFMASLIHRGMPSRVFRTAALFVAFLLLINYWGLTIL